MYAACSFVLICNYVFINLVKHIHVFISTICYFCSPAGDQSIEHGKQRIHAINSNSLYVLSFVLLIFKLHIHVRGNCFT